MHASRWKDQNLEEKCGVFWLRGGWHASKTKEKSQLKSRALCEMYWLWRVRRAQKHLHGMQGLLLGLLDLVIKSLVCVFEL